MCICIGTGTLLLPRQLDTALLKLEEHALRGASAIDDFLFAMVPRRVLDVAGK
jgi:hypothetical protein